MAKASGWTLYELHQETGSLEELFRELTVGGARDSSPNSPPRRRGDTGAASMGPCDERRPAGSATVGRRERPSDLDDRAPRAQGAVRHADGLRPAGRVHRRQRVPVLPAGVPLGLAHAPADARAAAVAVPVLRPAVTMRTLAEDTRSGMLEVVLDAADHRAGAAAGQVRRRRAVPVDRARAARCRFRSAWRSARTCSGARRRPVRRRRAARGGARRRRRWASSLTRSQITAFILGVAVMFVLILVGLDPLLVGLPAGARRDRGAAGRALALREHRARRDRPARRDLLRRRWPACSWRSRMARSWAAGSRAAGGARAAAAARRRCCWPQRSSS